MIVALFLAWLAFLTALPPRPSPWIVVASGLPLLLLASWGRARAAGQPWRAFAAGTADLHALALVLLYALGVQFADAHGITTDGVTYFAHLRSVVFDRDLDVAREFAILGQPPRPTHVVPIGPLLVWTPFYLSVAGVDGLGRLAGFWSAPADMSTLGLGLAYIRAALVSSYIVGAAGLWALLLHLRERFAPPVAWVAVVLTFGATPLYWYMVYEPSMTHAVSFGFAALFCVLCARWLPDGVTVRRSVALGSLLGLAFAARSQEVLFLVLPALLLSSAAGPWPERMRRAAGVAGWAFLGALPWLALQAAHSYVMFSRYDYTLVGQGGYLDPWHSRWLDTLFSSWHGFFSWTPVAYVAALGTLAYVGREWRWASAGLAVLLLTAWINGATQDWAGGWSFGGRRFSSVLVLLAPGLALVVEAVVRRPLVAVAPLVVAALWWNHLLMVQYTAGLLPKDEPVSFGRIVRQQAELHTRPPYAYPFAFPANAWFAWREGLPIEKYDLLSPERAQTSFHTVFDRAVEKYLLDGWEAPGGDDWGAAWWLGGSPATLVVPLALAPGPVSITIRTRTRFDEPAVQARLAIDVNGAPAGEFVAGVPGASTTTLTIPADRADAVFRAGINRIAIRSLGVARVDPSDPRPAGPLASRTGPVWPVAVYELRIERAP